MAIGENIILATDSYKQSHWRMYPPDMTHLTSYLEAREGGEYSSTIFFGLQYIMEKHLSGIRVSLNGINEAEAMMKKHFGRAGVFNRENWVHILREHGGRLPVMIRSVPEGLRVPNSNVMLTIQNTCRHCAWVVNHLETLLVELWYPCTVATVSAELKKILVAAWRRSCDVPPDNVPFMAHDFGYRGSTSVESAAIGGAAHLINFLGTDTIAAMELLRDYYDGENAGHYMGYSVPAAEHSTVTAWGEHGELDAYRHILQEFPSGIVSVVSDSWDIYQACERLWGGQLHNYVWSGQNSGRVLVVRPDSGNPVEVVPNVLDILGKQFGSSVNHAGYKMLPSFLRVIQGDGITRESLSRICDAVMDRGWSIANMVFGSGGGLLQSVNRDTQRFAMKCSAIKTSGDDQWIDVFKRPATDPGKNSKRGYLFLSSDFKTHAIPEYGDILKPVFKNGEIIERTTLASIRGRRGW